MHHRVVHATSTTTTNGVVSENLNGTNGTSCSNGIKPGTVTVTNGGGVTLMSGSSSSPRRRRTVTNRFNRKSTNPYKNQQFVQTWVVIFCMGVFMLLLGIFIGTKLSNDYFPNISLPLPSSSGGGGGNGKPEHPDDLTDLPFNSHYIIPGSHPKVGDRSNRYIKLRKTYDETHTKDPRRSLEFMQQLQRNSDYKYDTAPIPDPRGNEDEEEYTQYDIYNCPDTPPKGYPYQWKALKVLTNWPTNDIEIQPNKRTIHQGLCVFDYATEYEKAMTYREMEVPFVVKNDPDIAETVERWNLPGYMDQLMSTTPHRTEYSENNQFLYSTPQSPGGNKKKKRGQTRIQVPKDWKPPTELTRMPYQEWLEHANTTALNDGDNTKKVAFDAPHWYYRLIGCGYLGRDGDCDKGSSEYLYDELPFLQPRDNLLYIVEPLEQKGIHCRFGMDGVIAENHFDGSRNTIVLLKGTRRYILGHPKSCEDMALYPMNHPSARHSQIDWSTQPDDKEELAKYPEFANAEVNEIILQAGDALYLPTHWFHYIVSLELNFQCNTRSGIGYEYAPIVRKCGFKV